MAPERAWYERLNEEEERLCRALIAQLRTVKGATIEIRWTPKTWLVYRVRREEVLELTVHNL